MKDYEVTINQLIADELNRANEMYPDFHSYHEAYGVLKEEIEEADHDMEYVKIHLNNVWAYTKCNDQGKALMHIGCCKERARNAIYELIQVCAMCDKAVLSLEGDD